MFSCKLGKPLRGAIHQNTCEWLFLKTQILYLFRVHLWYCTFFKKAKIVSSQPSNFCLLTNWLIIQNLSIPWYPVSWTKELKFSKQLFFKMSAESWYWTELFPRNFNWVLIELLQIPSHPLVDWWDWDVWVYIYSEILNYPLLSLKFPISERVW